MDIKDRLNRIRKIDIFIRVKEIEKKNTIDLYNKFDYLSSDTIKSGSKIINYIDQEITELKEEVEEIRTLIYQLEDERERQVLTLRYLNNKSYDDISEDMYYSLGQIYRIHRKAINNLNKLI